MSLRPQILKRSLHNRSTNLVVFVHYISRDFFPNDLHEYRILRLVLLRILGDPWVSWGQLGREKRRDESFQARAEECLKTFVAPFLLWRRSTRKFVQNHRSRAQKVHFRLTCVPQNRRCFSNHLSTIVIKKKWEILCTAPSTENPRKLLLTTNTLELSYPVI